MSLFKCPVCGVAKLRFPPYAQWPPPEGVELIPPYELQLGCPSYEVCPSCGYEFGNDDNPGTAAPETFEQYRERWIAEGSKWFDRETRPD